MKSCSSRFSLLFIFLTVITISFAQVRKKTSINAHWVFYKGSLEAPKIPEANTTVVNLPHTWNARDVLADGKRGYYRGDGWYFKEIHVTPNSEKKYFLHFEGANQLTVLYVNGREVGIHKGGYSAFTFDITGFLKQGQNTLALKINNAHHPDIPPLSADFTFFGGIYRDVFLIETGNVHINLLDYGSKGFFVSTPTIGNETATVKIKGSLTNQASATPTVALLAEIRDRTGEVVARQRTRLRLKEETIPFELSLQLPDPQLWSPDSPYLYTVELTLESKGTIVDEAWSNFGVRTFRFDADNGFFLNGKPLKLIGANRHQDYQGLGNALADDIHRNDLRLIKEMGGNFVRLAHYPQDPAVLEEADRLGLLVWEETPLVNEVTVSEAHDDNSEIMLREMIRQHYNHPSIILWGYMNEIYWAHRFLDEAAVNRHTEATIRLSKRLEAVARKEDPTRYTAMALHNYPLYETSGIAEIPQVVGWNLYHGWYYDTFEDFGKFLDAQHKKYPDRIHMISEFGAGSDPRLHSENPERFDFTMEGHKALLESYLEQIMARPFIAGATVWNLIDFSSERRVDTKPHLNQKGLLTADRKPKDPFFRFQANLLDRPFVKIAETNHTHRTTVGDTTKNTIDVYSNQENISLFLNGVKVASQKVNGYKTSFKVVLKTGNNVVEARSENTSDRLEIRNKIIPKAFKKNEPVAVAVNVGSNHSFYDMTGDITWVADKPYEDKGWGHIGGKPLYVGKKIGTKEDIQTIEAFTPLYQTMREGVTAYRFDVPDGWYEVELLFVEPYPKSRRFVEGIESPEHPGGIRVFDVFINEEPLLQDLDLIKAYGYNYPLRKKTMVKAAGDKGILVSLNAIKGKTVLSAIAIRSLH